jgi:hypothetical protein
MNSRRPTTTTTLAWWLTSLSAFPLGCIPTAPPGTGANVAPEVRLGDCENAEQNVEFAPFMVADFEAGTATYLYSYVDNTATVDPRGYQPPTEAGQHCQSDPGSGVFHLTGGPFLGWGGGMGIALQHISAALCTGASPPDYCVPPGPQPGVNGSILDLSKWDGVALWARRGPNSQPLLRVVVGNKYTDDDVSYLMYNDDATTPRYCERVKECGCVNHLPCDFYPQSVAGVVNGGGFYCGTPGIVAGPDITAPGAGQLATNKCDITRCDDPYPAYPDVADGAFAGRKCRPYTYVSGLTSSFCFDPDGLPPDPGDPNAVPPRPARRGRDPDPPPAETDRQCGDHWTYPLHLTTDWRLYLVPFTWMYQQGFAKRFTFFDLKSLSVVRLTWDAGNVDYYVDNLRFYRVKRPPPAN